MKLLLTGFVPFLNHKTNPTEEVVKSLNGQTINDYNVEGHILPVDFNESEKELLREINEREPDIVIMLGLAVGRSRITPERIAINVKDGREDNSGFAPVDLPIIEDGLDGIFSTLPIRKMVDNLNAEFLPAKISNTAGTYLCNNMMYVALNAAGLEEKFKAGFIHIPASHELAIDNESLPSMSIDDLTRAVKICIETL